MKQLAWIRRLLFVWMCYLCASCTSALIDRSYPELSPTPGQVPRSLRRHRRHGLMRPRDLEYLLSTIRPDAPARASLTPPAAPLKGGPSLTPPAAPLKGGPSSGRAGLVPQGDLPRLIGTLLGTCRSPQKGGHRLAVFETAQAIRIVEQGEDLDDYTLVEVLHYQATLEDRAGQRYPLSLDGDAPVARKPASTPTPALAEGVVRSIGRRELVQLLDRASSGVNIQAVRRGDEIVGYRVAFGEENNAFARIGFQSQDILICFQDQVLSSPEALKSAYENLRNPVDGLHFRLERAGKTMSLDLEVTE